MLQDPPDGLNDQAEPDAIDMMQPDELRRELRAKLAALHRMASMPEYDQDDAHRLRHQAKLALANVAMTDAALPDS